MYFYSCEDFQVQRNRSTQQSLTQALCVSYRIVMWKTFSAHSKETSEVSPRSFGSVLLAKLQEPNPQASPWDPQLHPGPHPTWEGSLREFPAGSVVWALFPLPRTWTQYLVRTKIPQAMQYSHAIHSHAVWSQPAHSTPVVEHQALGLSSLRLSPSSVTLLLCVFLGKWLRFSESQWPPLKTGLLKIQTS